MADYIDRNAAIEAVKHAWAKGLNPVEYLEIISAADVAPTNRGKWIEISKEGNLYRCSLCGCFGQATTFCPNCGARMGVDG